MIENSKRFPQSPMFGVIEMQLTPIGYIATLRSSNSLFKLNNEESDTPHIGKK